MLKTQKVFWWRTGFANTEGKLGKDPDGEMGSEYKCLIPEVYLFSATQIVAN